MAFTPRIAESGRPCCCSYDNGYGTGEPLPPTKPCAKCRAHFALLQDNPMKNLEAYEPSDPYKAGIDAQRASDAGAAAKRTYQPALRPTVIPTDGTPPDPYKAGLERLREENR